MSVKLVMIAPAPATEKGGGVLAPPPPPDEDPPDDVLLVADDKAEVPPLPALDCELLEPASALLAIPGLAVPPAMAPATPTAPTLPWLCASTFKSWDRT